MSLYDNVHTNSVGTNHTNLNINLVDPPGQVNSIESISLTHTIQDSQNVNTSA
jgi:hypothetical protein